MPNELTDLQDEVHRLNEERRRKAGAPEQPQAGSLPAESTGERAAAMAPPVEAGPPRLLAISFEDRLILSSIGNFPIGEEESRKLVRIAMGALARKMRETFEAVAITHGVEPPKRTGLTSMAEFKADDES